MHETPHVAQNTSGRCSAIDGCGRGIGQPVGSIKWTRNYSGWTTLIGYTTGLRDRLRYTQPKTSACLGVVPLAALLDRGVAIRRSFMSSSVSMFSMVCNTCSRAEQPGSRWRVARGCRQRPRRLFWRVAWSRTGRRCIRCRCSRTTSSPPAGHSAHRRGT
jgi:hypothetical protein